MVGQLFEKVLVNQIHVLLALYPLGVSANEFIDKVVLTENLGTIISVVDLILDQISQYDKKWVFVDVADERGIKDHLVDIFYEICIFLKFLVGVVCYDEL